VRRSDGFSRIARWQVRRSSSIAGICKCTRSGATDPQRSRKSPMRVLNAAINTRQ
jgi:hypothetical protein